MIRRAVAFVGVVSPLVLVVVAVVILSVAPSAIMGLQLYRTTHRLAQDETVIARLQEGEIADTRAALGSKAAEAEVRTLSERVDALVAVVDDMLSMAPSVRPADLDQRVAAAERELVALVRRMVALERQPGAHQGVTVVPSSAPLRSTPSAGVRSAHECVLSPILMCSGGSGSFR